MSAFPDDADHFVRWLAARHGGAAASFVPRLLYGEYLAETLAAVRDDRLTLCTGDVRAVTDAASGWPMDARSRRTWWCWRPATCHRIRRPASIRRRCRRAAISTIRGAPDPARGLGAEDRVLLLGTGLTAIDVALQLDASGFEGRSSPCRGAGCGRIAMSRVRPGAAENRPARRGFVGTGPRPP